MTKKHPTTLVGLTLSFAASVSLMADRHAKLPVTKAEQDKLTPAAVLADLAAGNKRYVDGKLSAPNIKARVDAAVEGQFPKAYILSCIDSRVPVEMVFDQGLGDLFVGRVAGNVENGDQLGSMEFAAAVSGVKAIVVLGHQACGAVKGACDHVKMGNLTGLLANIEPAVEAVKGHHDKGRNSKNAAFVAEVVETNVRLTVKDIRERSKTLSKLESEGKIKIVGAIYSLDMGSVIMLN